MAVPGEVYRAVHKYMVRGEECQNVYHYIVEPANASINSAWGSFVGSFAPILENSIAPLQNINATWLSVEVANLNNLDDYGIYPFVDVTGERVGDCEPAFMTFTFMLHRSTRAMRNGRKAISGVTESDHTGDQADAAIDGQIANAIAFFEVSITDAHGTMFSPVICRISGATGRCDTYTKVSGASFRWISTQNSRKS